MNEYQVVVSINGGPAVARVIYSDSNQGARQALQQHLERVYGPGAVEVVDCLQTARKGRGGKAR